MTAGLIDLDAAPPGPAGSGPRPNRPVPRSVRLVALLALVLTAMAGSAPPRPGLVRVLSAGGTAAAAFALGPDRLYLAHDSEEYEGPGSGHGSVLWAYRLPDGAPVWSGHLDQTVRNLEVDASSHVLMARSGSDPRTVFLDADTGDTLWRTAGAGSAVITVARGRALIRTDITTTATALRLVDVRTGRPFWTRTVDSTAELGPDQLYGSAPSRIVAVGATGSVVVLDWASGVVLTRGDLHVPRTGGPIDPALPFDSVSVSTVGDRLYVSRRTRGRTSATAYSTVPLARLWTAAGGPVGEVSDCGLVLCVTDTRWVSGLDPATGAVRWADPAWSVAFRYRADRLFAFGQQEIPEAAVLDAATGRVIGRLGRTSLLGDLTLTADAREPGRVLVGEPNPADGTLRVVGPLDDVVTYACDVRDRYVACLTEPGRTAVWKLP